MTEYPGSATDNAEVIARLPKDFAELETWIGEARDQGYLEGQADCAGAHAELWNKVIRWAESRDLLGEPDEQSGGYTSEQLFDAIVSHENELDQALIKVSERIAELERDDEESYKVGVRDGYEEAVQDIDLMTGGDGEYRWSTEPERNTSDAPAMVANIEARFEELRVLRELADARAEAAEAKVAELERRASNAEDAVKERRNAWKTDDLMIQLAGIRHLLGKLQPQSAAVIADAETRIMVAEARIKALKIAAVKAVEPLEALRMLGPSGISGELWTGIVEGSDAVRAALAQIAES